MTKKQRIHLRAERRDANLCLDCGSSELGTNKDGTTSKYCVTCQPIHSTARKKNNYLAPVKHCPDTGLTDTFLDTAQFTAYCLAVYRNVKKIGRATIGSLRRAMGEHFDERRIFPALESLMGDGKIAYKQMGSMQSWTVSEPRVEPKRHFIHASEHRSKIVIAPPADRTRPSVESFERAREVGA